MRFVVEVMPSTFGMEAGAAKSAFDPDSNTLKVFVDLQRMADRQQLATLVGCEVTSHLRTDWLDDSNIALLRAAGNVIPDVVIQDNRKGFAETVIEEGRQRAREIGKPVIVLDEHEPVSLQSYSVTWRRPAAAYAHDEIEATSLEDAMMQAKTMATSNRSDLFFDTDNDSMDACDWISVEGAGDGKDALFTHTEWELPKPSAGVLMKALHDIEGYCEAAINSGTKIHLAAAMDDILGTVRKAIANAIPGGG